MQPKPVHLGPEYGAQFSDQSVADAYPMRPPYPAHIIDTLAQLAADEPRDVLELGCGCGDVTRFLAPHVRRMDAVDPSAAMLNKAKTLPGGLAENIRWVNQTAELFDYPQAYSLIFAAESLHWMAWDVIFPRIRRALTPNGRLALVLGRELSPQPWMVTLGPLIGQYSTNRAFQSYDLIDELTRRSLFTLETRLKTEPQAWSQTVAGYVESFHSRNGFSRERMGDRAREFDAQVEALVAPYAQDGVLHFEITGEIAWGRPQAKGVNQRRAGVAGNNRLR